MKILLSLFTVTLLLEILNVIWNAKYMAGHFGVINFPYTIIHPYFVSEVVQILNKICPGCKSIRRERRAKVRYLPYQNLVTLWFCFTVLSRNSAWLVKWSYRLIKPKQSVSFKCKQVKHNLSCFILSIRVCSLHSNLDYNATGHGKEL